MTLRKVSDPAIGIEALGAIDFILLSHDHHFDKLDHTGRTALAKAKVVLTTVEGAARLGGNSVGLGPWQSIDLPGGLRVVATPARHGPAEHDRGPVVGFVITQANAPERAVYVAGDTVWYDGVAEVAQRFSVRVALLNLGAARVPEVGPFHLTMTAGEGVEAARAFADAVVVPLHFEGWAHFSEGRAEIVQTFDAAGMADRLRWPEPGRAVAIA